MDPENFDQAIAESLDAIGEERDHVGGDTRAGPAAGTWARLWQDKASNMNEEQKDAFEVVKYAIENPDEAGPGENLFFIEGAGGTGSFRMPQFTASRVLRKVVHLQRAHCILQVQGLQGDSNGIDWNRRDRSRRRHNTSQCFLGASRCQL